jgi:cell division ATPase FtsA
MTRESKNLIVGLDIGTSKIVTVVAEMPRCSRYRNRSKTPN